MFSSEGGRAATSIHDDRDESATSSDTCSKEDGARTTRGPIHNHSGSTRGGDDDDENDHRNGDTGDGENQNSNDVQDNNSRNFTKEYFPRNSSRAIVFEVIHDMPTLIIKTKQVFRHFIRTLEKEEGGGGAPSTTTKQQQQPKQKHTQKHKHTHQDRQHDASKHQHKKQHKQEEEGVRPLPNADKDKGHAHKRQDDRKIPAKQHPITVSHRSKSSKTSGQVRKSAIVQQSRHQATTSARRKAASSSHQSWASNRGQGLNSTGHSHASNVPTAMDTTQNSTNAATMPPSRSDTVGTAARDSTASQSNVTDWVQGLLQPSASSSQNRPTGQDAAATSNAGNNRKVPTTGQVNNPNSNYPFGVTASPPIFSILDVLAFMYIQEQHPRRNQHRKYKPQTLMEFYYMKNNIQPPTPSTAAIAPQAATENSSNNNNSSASVLAVPPPPRKLSPQEHQMYIKELSQALLLASQFYFLNSLQSTMDTASSNDPRALLSGAGTEQQTSQASRSPPEAAAATAALNHDETTGARRGEGRSSRVTTTAAAAAPGSSSSTSQYDNEALGNTIAHMARQLMGPAAETRAAAAAAAAAAAVSNNESDYKFSAVSSLGSSRSSHDAQQHRQERSSSQPDGSDESGASSNGAILNALTQLKEVGESLSTSSDSRQPSPHNGDNNEDRPSAATITTGNQHTTENLMLLGLLATVAQGKQHGVNSQAEALSQQQRNGNGGRSNNANSNRRSNGS